MGFGNSKRMDLVKDLLKEEKKKKAALKKKKAMGRSSSASSMSSSRNSALSLSTSNSSTAGSDDPFHAKRVMKVGKMWDKAKQGSDPVALGQGFLEQILPMSHSEEQCKVLVETIDWLINVMGPDLDDEELEEASTKLAEGGIPAAALGKAFATCMNTLLGGDLSQKDIDTMDNSIGMLLRTMGSDS